jgi:hypothetical protein
VSQNQLPKKNSNEIKRRIFGDRFFVFIFVVVDLVLIFAAKRNIHNLNVLASRVIASNSVADEDYVLQELQKHAQSGAWEEFEKVRLEKVSGYLHSNVKPGAGHAVYFFPETLSPQSFERSFAVFELQPGIEALKKAVRAHENPTDKNVSKAYRQLKSRVENYELGKGTDPSQLSEEATQFLHLYRDLSKLSE